jgi:hypothetical protein
MWGVSDEMSHLVLALTMCYGLTMYLHTDIV